MNEQLPHADYKTPYYQVAKMYSGVTDNVELWEIKSRIIRTIEGANDWLSFEQSQDPDGKYFILTKYTPEMNEWIDENEARIYKLQYRRMYKNDDAMNKVEALVDKLRHVCDNSSEQAYLRELLGMFDPESGDFKHE